MIVIGIDPGYLKTGYGVVQLSSTFNISIIEHGTINLKVKECCQKLLTLSKDLNSLSRKYAPDVAAIEDVFYAQNNQSYVKLGKIVGVTQVTLAQYMPVHTYNTLSIKKVVTGFGKSDKKIVRDIVMTICSHGYIKDLDASDALAAAICHLYIMNPDILRYNLETLK